jgi:para-aminobenzoate synthetase / 4-amino-4-deoxychorismate lyase
MHSFPHPDPEKGVFETMLVVEGRAVEIDAHLARLEASLEALFGAAMPVGVRDDLLAEASNLSLGRLRLTVAPGSGSLVHSIAVADVDRATVFPGWERSVALRGVPAPDWAGGHKWADRSGLERLEASLDGEAPLLLGEGGVPLETSRANVFAVRGGALTTPPLDGRVLPGIARARTIEIVAALGIEVRGRDMALADLQDAEEVFLTGSVRGIEPARSLDGVELKARGDMTAFLAAQLRRHWLG